MTLESSFCSQVVASFLCGRGIVAVAVEGVSGIARGDSLVSLLGDHANGKTKRCSVQALLTFVFTLFLLVIVRRPEDR